MNPTPALVLHQVSKRLGGSDILCDVSLSVAPGERVALIGPNGAGKSTVFQLLSGALAPDRGSVMLFGQSIAGRKPHQINRLGLARSFQITQIFGALSVRENLQCSVLWSLGYRYRVWSYLAPLPDVARRVDAMLDLLGLQAQSAQPAQHLSYAEQRALELGMTTIGGAPVVLLDEPTAGMSQSETQRCTALIRHLTEGRTLLTVEHDMGVVFHLADRIAVLAGGRLLAIDTPEAIRRNPQVQQAYLGHFADAVGAAEG